MRFPVLMRRAILLLAIPSPMLLYGQFQPISQEELKMTSDPKAAGAAAEYLDVEDVTDDMLHSRIIYARIKVLQEEGKELASVEVPSQGKQEKGEEFATMQLPYQGLFQPTLVTGNRRVVTDFKARVIHPDGTIIPLEGKPEELLKVENSPRQGQRTVVHLPGVEVGSILEYRYVERYEGLYTSPFWNVQRDFFVRKAHFSFLPYKSFQLGLGQTSASYLIDKHGTPLNFLLYWPQLPPHANFRRDQVGRFLLDVSDVPAAPQEEWMPPNNSLRYRVHFYYRSDSDARGFWQKQAKVWSKEVDRLAEPTKTIRDAVDGLISPSNTDMEKAKKLYSAAQALENTDFLLRQGGVERDSAFPTEKRAEDTWMQKSGSSQDIALLYLAMTRAAGLTAYAMRVVDRDRGAFAQDYLYFDQLDDDIVLVTIGGKEVALDPGQKMCPFETVAWKHTGATGIRENASGGMVATSPSPAYTGNSLFRMGDLTVDEHGGVAGSFRFTMTGQDALRWRQAALVSNEADVKKSFDLWLESTEPQGMEARIDRFDGIAAPEANLVAIVRVRGSFGTAPAQGFPLPCFPFEFHSHHPFIDEAHRTTPVDMHYGEQITDQVTYHLPAGMRVEGAPQDARIPWEGHAVFEIKTKSESSQITIARSLARAFTLASVNEFQGLRDFYEKVSSADQQELTLSHAAGAGAN